MADEVTSGKRRTRVEAADLPIAIQRLKQRLDGLLNETARVEAEWFIEAPDGAAISIAIKINETYDDIFGHDSQQAFDARLEASDFETKVIGASHYAKKGHFLKVCREAASRLNAIILTLEDRFELPDTNPAARALRAYGDLDLHPEIERVASKLYGNGHYANAIEDAVKALNALVRLRSGEELDGAQLMERVFSPKTPILRFNDLVDPSDLDEQKGFMMMFAGAVAGLRNPRAHKLIQDDPERALEFIAYVSLLAKLLYGAKKV